MTAGIVIVGGGQAAVSAAARVRELDEQVPLTLISDEAVLPYQRPPLSKKYLSGEMPLERLILRPEQWFAENNIEVRLNSRVEALQREDKSLTLFDGEKLSYDKLLLATGSQVRKLPAAMGGELEGVHYLRSTADSDAMRPDLTAGKRLVVVGGGYIGLEVSAVAAQMGMDVTLVEMASRILQRVAASQTSDYYRALHLNHGVKIIEGTGLSKLVGQSGKIDFAELSDGTTLDADAVLVGIGVIPCLELAEMAGLAIENGVCVNETCQSSDPDIYAAGDCASFPFKGKTVRLESVPNAIHQAEIAAENMLGSSKPYLVRPWFWSDQYDVKLQIVGLNAGYDSTVLRAGRREGSQSIWYYEGNQLLAVDAMNDAASFMIARKVLESGGNIPKTAVQDETQNLKEWV